MPDVLPSQVNTTSVPDKQHNRVRTIVKRRNANSDDLVRKSVASFQDGSRAGTSSEPEPELESRTRRAHEPQCKSARLGSGLQLEVERHEHEPSASWPFDPLSVHIPFLATLILAHGAVLVHEHTRIRAGDLRSLRLHSVEHVTWRRGEPPSCSNHVAASPNQTRTVHQKLPDDKRQRLRHAATTDSATRRAPTPLCH